MKAVVYEKYGSPEVLELKEVDKPIPKENEVLVKIHTTAVTSGDARLRRADPFITRLFFGLTKPKINILGVELAGVVEEIGKDVKLFQVGDKVFGSSFDCGFGAYAEYKCLPEDTVIMKKPENISYEKAAAIFFGGNTALHFLKKGNIGKGQKVLIYGASGAIGVYAVQLAKYYEAEVTGICSTKNIELVKSLGADFVVDYTKEDFTKIDKKYDIIFDTVGKSDFSKSVKSLNKKGIYLRAVNLTPESILNTIWTNLTTSKKVIGGVATETKDSIAFLTKLIEEDKITPVIDKVYPIEDISKAHAYVDKGHKVGTVVIKVI